MLSVQLDRPTRVQGTWIQLLLRPGEPNPEFVKIWERWDALWYMQIAQNGYQAADNTVAFFPLYPGLLHVAGAVLRQNYALAGLIVSGLALIPALWLLGRLGQTLIGARSARRAVLYTLLFPTGFFFLAPYTESLFLLLAVGVFWCMHRRQWACAGLLGLLAGLTRAPGALLLLPMVWEWLEQRIAGERHHWPTFLWTITPGLGLLLFTAYIRFVLGLPEAGLATQAAWGYHVVMPWQAISTSFARAQVDPIEAINLSSLLVMCGLTLLGIKRLPAPYTLYNLANIGIMLTRVEDAWPLMSVSRYVLVLFPGFLVLAQLSRGRRWLQQGIAGLGLLLMAVLFYHYIHFRFVA
ncbi:MAG TPA: mannosyltransferase family protein [Chloroflexota bacterium]